MAIVSLTFVTFDNLVSTTINVLKKANTMKTSLLILLVLTSLCALAQTPESNLKELGIEIPELSPPIASYVDVVRVGNLLFLSGKGPRSADGEYVTGKLGGELSIEQGYEAAKLTAINQLAVLKGELGDLSKVKRVVKVLGFVNSTDDFTDQPKVINGFSDFMIQVFGEPGRHARTAVGTNALPFNMAVEVELIVEVE